MRLASHNSRRGAHRGYTLMEMMVVVALVAIAAALVAPSIGHAFGNFELRLAATSVSTLFKQARTRAVYEGHSCAVVFGPAAESPRTLYLVREDGKTLERAVLPSGVKLRIERGGEWSYETEPLHFFSNGSSQAAQFDLAGDRERHLQLVLDPLTARARVSQIYGGGEASAGSVSVSQGGSR
jgi:prepilin-type N-terminal cleavage/methylation domain-containing protein